MVGQHFAVSGPQLWNQLPAATRKGSQVTDSQLTDFLLHPIDNLTDTKSLSVR